MGIDLAPSCNNPLYPWFELYMCITGELYTSYFYHLFKVSNLHVHMEPPNKVIFSYAHLRI